MNLTLIALRLFLKNPPHRSILDDLPLIVLPNGRRVTIETFELDVTMLGDACRRTHTTYRLHREVGTQGERIFVGEFYTLDDVAASLREESKSLPTRTIASYRPSRR